MPDKCCKCNAEVVLIKDGVKCSDCAVGCHVSCAGVVGRNKKWKCEKCSLESSSDGSKASDQGATNASILEAINAFRKENNDKWAINAETLELLRNDINTIKSEVEDFKIQLEDVREKCTRTSDAVEQLKCENKRLNTELTTVKLHVQDLEQHTRKNNILISGVPLTPKEDIHMLISAVAKALDLEFYGSEVSIAHRLQGRKGDSRPPSIVVCFVSRWVKTNWLAARRRKRSLTARDISRSFPETPVFINEHLTTQTRAVFNEARGLVKEKRLSSVWTSDCRVMAKLTPEHRPFRVQDLQHVAELSAGTSQGRKTGTSASPTLTDLPQETSHPVTNK